MRGDVHTGSRIRAKRKVLTNRKSGDRHDQKISARHERDRRGYQYSQPNWAERDGRWVMTRGNWRRNDRDGDGIPNRVDRDRDGDGVRNSQDRRPGDPRRY
jgi:hypothetical protein